MIAYLKGEITYKTPTQIYIECSQVGYLVNISLYTYTEIEKLQHVKLFTHLVIREDAHTLYGFFAEEEKNMFVNLIAVSGVGPNTARLILSSMSTIELHKAIISDDVRLIQSIKGIGPKSAQRLILELKDKLKKEPLSDGMQTILQQSSSSNKYTEEAVAALCMLGFQKVVAEKAMMKAMKENGDINSVEDLIKRSLKNL